MNLVTLSQLCRVMKTAPGYLVEICPWGYEIDMEKLKKRVKPGEGESISDAVKRIYGQYAHDLLEELIR